MHKPNKYDALFSELKHEIRYDPHKKSETLHHLKTVLPANQRKSNMLQRFTTIIISVSSLVVAACLMLLLLNKSDTPNVANPANEPTHLENEQNPPLTEGHTIFNVENFGKEDLTLKNGILDYLNTLYLENYESTDVFDTVKIDGNGVVILNFTHSFVDAYNNSMGTAGAGEFLRNINMLVFSYNNEVQTIYYLLDGDASAWNDWLQAVDEPITREEYEKYSSNSPSIEDIFSIKEEKFYLYGVTINDSKEAIIATLGNDYTEEKDLEIGGESSFDRIIYENLDLTLLFLQDHLRSASVEIHNTEGFDRYFEAYTGNKLAHIVNEKEKSTENIRILFSEESLHVATAIYDPFELLSFGIGSTTPEAIQNYKNGLLE